MCIYKTKDGKCKKFSDDTVTSWCVNSPCEDETQTNYDRTMNMSVEELAKFLLDIGYDYEYGEWVTTNNEQFADYYYEKALAEEIKWLESEVDTE